jgi:hypothetical protein
MRGLGSTPVTETPRRTSASASETVGHAEDQHRAAGLGRREA